MKQLREEFLREADRLCGRFPAQVRTKQPLVHLLTNYVTVTDCVNAVLAIGGRAICSHAPQEAAQVSSGADAIVCNLGGTEYYDAMEDSAQAALAAGIPLVIDPVGCAASEFRRQKCLHLTEAYHPAAIRGNYAEIAALTDGAAEESGEGGIAEGRIPAAGTESAPRSGSAGLDSVGELTGDESVQLKSHMTAFARRYGTILIASGAIDLCTDGTRMIEVTGGTSALKRITGAGCLSTAVLAAYLAAQDSDALGAASAAVRFVGLAGEYAQRACLRDGTGAGHFHMYLMDFLSASDAAFF